MPSTTVKVADYRVTRRLTMAEAAVMLGWTTVKNPERSTRERLRRMGRACGVRLLFGGGKHGAQTWTTMSALRHGGLVDDFAELMGETGVELRALSARIEAVEKCVRLLATALGRMDAKLEGEENSSFRAFVLPHLPDAAQGDGKRLPGRPRGTKNRHEVVQKQKLRRKKRGKKAKAVVQLTQDDVVSDSGSSENCRENAQT